MSSRTTQTRTDIRTAAPIAHRSSARPRLSRAAALIAVAGAAALGAIAPVAVASPALAHDELVSSGFVVDPAGGSLDAVQLTFSNSIIELGTEIIVTGPDGDSVADGAPVVDGPDVTQALADPLAPGDYTGAWRVVSSDGHPIDGAFAFTVEEGMTEAPTLTQRESTGEDGAVEDGAVEEEEPRFADEDEHSASDHEHAEEGAQQGAPVGALIAVVVGGAAVIAGGLAAATVGRRRRARGMTSDGDAS